MRIREFGAADTDAVVRLWQDAGLTRPWNDPRNDIERKLRMQPELFLVAVDEQEQIVGTVMAGYTGFRGWINYMAVAPSAQGVGVGRQLMAVVRKRLLAMGCSKLNLQVRSDNLQAVGFYQSIGFSEDAVMSMGLRLIED